MTIREILNYNFSLGFLQNSKLRDIFLLEISDFYIESVEYKLVAKWDYEYYYLNLCFMTNKSLQKIDASSRLPNNDSNKCLFTIEIKDIYAC